MLCITNNLMQEEQKRWVDEKNNMQQKINDINNLLLSCQRRTKNKRSKKEPELRPTAMLKNKMAKEIEKRKSFVEQIKILSLQRIAQKEEHHKILKEKSNEWAQEKEGYLEKINELMNNNGDECELKDKINNNLKIDIIRQNNITEKIKNNI